jgi:hypothetical protein
MMNIFEQVIEIEKNGRLWKLSAFRRYDPITLTLLITGTALKVSSTIQQGKDAQTIANQRAAVDEQNAEAVREASVEKAKIQGERRQRLIATQKATAAAGNIRINVGSPLVIETETRDSIAKDIGFSLKAGRVETESLLQSSKLERAIGESQKKQSVFNAASQVLLGAGSIALAGSRLPKKPTGGSFNPLSTNTVTRRGIPLFR